MVDLAIGLGIPILEMILRELYCSVMHSDNTYSSYIEYIPQGHRFNIFEEIGCFPYTYTTPVSFPTVWCWPAAIGCVSAVYCGSYSIVISSLTLLILCTGLTIRTLAKRRSEFNQLLSGNNNLNSSRYLRLMGLAGIDMCFTVPWGAYSIYLNAVGGIEPWLGWADTHSHFGYVGQFPAFEWKMSHLTITSLELSRWSLVLCSFIFFAFFGFAQEARKNYRLAFNSVAKRVGYTTAGGMGSGISSSFGSKQPTSSSVRGTLPVFIRQETTSKHDSYASFSTNLTIGDVGGTLDDVKAPYSPTDSSSSSSQYEYDIEKSLPIAPPALSQAEPTFDHLSPPHHPADAPTAARPDSSIV